MQRRPTAIHFLPGAMLAIVVLVMAACTPFTATPSSPSSGTPVAATSAPGSAPASTAGATASPARPVSSETPGSTTQGGLFAGAVRHAGQPVANGRVELRELGWATNRTPAVATAYADSQGNFSLAGPPVGDFSVIGYFADGEVDAGGWPPVSIQAGQQIRGFIVPLERKMILLSPIAGSTASATPALRWNPSTEAARYRVLIIDAGTTAVLLDRTLEETSIQVSQALEPGEYQWVVNGLDADGQLVATGQETFKVKAAGSETPETARLPDRDRAFEGAREALARRLGIDPLAVQRVDVTPQEWNDACMGVTSAREMCAQVITPGWIVILQAGGRRYEAHADQEGLHVRFVGLK